MKKDIIKKLNKQRLWIALQIIIIYLAVSMLLGVATSLAFELLKILKREEPNYTNYFTKIGWGFIMGCLYIIHFWIKRRKRWKLTLDGIKKKITNYSSAHTGKANWTNHLQLFKETTIIFHDELQGTNMSSADGPVVASRLVSKGKTLDKFKEKYSEYIDLTDKKARKKLRKQLAIVMEKITIPILKDGELNIPDGDKTTVLYFVGKSGLHTCIIGSTGSGKTEGIVEPTMRVLSSLGDKANRPTLIATDPKGELKTKLGNSLIAKGYKVLAVDFREPNNSSAWNPLTAASKLVAEKIKLNNATSKKDIALLSSTETELDDVVNEIADAMYAASKEDKNPYWTNKGKDLFKGYLWFMLEEHEKHLQNNDTYPDGSIMSTDKINITSLIAIANMGTSELWKYYGYTQGPMGWMPPEGAEAKLTSTSKAYPLLKDWWSLPDETRESIRGTFTEGVQIFRSSIVRAITSTNNINLEQLTDVPTALFLIIPDDRKSYNKLATLLISQLYKALVSKANSNTEKKLKNNVHVLADEFANIPPIPDFESMITVARSRGIRFHIVLQSLSQLEQNYGKASANTILSNLNNTIFLKTNDLITAQDISRRIGDTTVHVDSESGRLRDEKSVSTSQRTVALIRPEELLEMPLWNGVLLGDRFNYQVEVIPSFPFRNELEPFNVPEGDLVMPDEAWYNKHAYFFGSKPDNSIEDKPKERGVETESPSDSGQEIWNDLTTIDNDETDSDRITEEVKQPEKTSKQDLPSVEDILAEWYA